MLARLNEGGGGGVELVERGNDKAVLWMSGSVDATMEDVIMGKVGEWSLTSKHPQMESIRKRSLDVLYALWDSKDAESVPSPPSLDTFLASDTLSIETLQLEGFPSTLANVLDEIWSENVYVQLHATTQTEILLSLERQCSTTLLQNGVVRRFVHFLLRGDSSYLQVEAAWALIKIFYGTCGNTKAEAARQAVPCFVRLLDSPKDSVSDYVREMAVFALGMVADDCRKYRDLVLNNGALVPLLEHLKEHANLGNHANFSMLRNLTWTLSILCEDISARSYAKLQPALTTLKDLLHIDDLEVLINSCWVIYNVTLEVHGRINPLMDAGLCPELVQHILHTSRRVQIPVLLTLSLIPIEKTHIQALIDNGAIRHVLTVLTQDRKDKCPEVGYYRLKKEACRVIARILKGNEHQIQAVIDAGLFGHVLKLLESPDNGVQVEAARVISIATYCASPNQIKYLVYVCEIINPMCNLLSSPITAAVNLGLLVLKNVLEAGETSKQDLGSIDVCRPPPNNPYIELINEAGCVEKIDEIWKGNCGFDAEMTDLAYTIMCLMGLIDEYPSDNDYDVEL